MEFNDKLDTITKSLIAIESVLLGVNGAGGMVGDMRDLKGIVNNVGEDVADIKGDQKAFNVKLDGIIKEQDEHTGKIKTLFINLNENKNNLSSLSVKMGVCAFVGSTVAVAIIGVLVNSLMGVS